MPLVQVLFDKANEFVKRKMTTWKKQIQCTDWESSFEFIERSINSSTCKGLPRNMVLHKALFGHNRVPEDYRFLKLMELSFDEIDRIVLQSLGEI